MSVRAQHTQISHPVLLWLMDSNCKCPTRFEREQHRGPRKKKESENAKKEERQRRELTVGSRLVGE
eukprot:504508-Rhodomonas_salina.4